MNARLTVKTFGGRGPGGGGNIFLPLYLAAPAQAGCTNVPKIARADYWLRI